MQWVGNGSRLGYPVMNAVGMECVMLGYPVMNAAGREVVTPRLPCDECNGHGRCHA